MNYNASVTPAVLNVSASIDLGWSKTNTGSVDINNFTIDSNGQISKFDIKANVTAAPVDVTLHASWDGTQFSGTFDGKFGGNIRFNGDVVLGATSGPSGYDYGYLHIGVNLGDGIPIGNSGLKLTGLGGGFGCNYLPPGAPAGASGPTQDAYYIQASITITDVAKLASLSGDVSVELGTSKAVGIAGKLQVTQGTPYFTGTLTCNYTLGSGAVGGSLTCSVHVPSDGSVVSINSNVINYAMGPTTGRCRRRSRWHSLRFHEPYRGAYRLERDFSRLAELDDWERQRQRRRKPQRVVRVPRRVHAVGGR